MMETEPDPRHPLAIEARGVIQRFGPKIVLAGVTLTVAQGEIVGLLGPNGAGKSTLVSAIAGLRPPRAGRIRVAGRNPARDRRVRELLGVQLQDAQFHDALSVGELIAMFATFYSAPRSAESLLAMVGLGADAKTRVSNLSGGQHQRLALAVALIGRPPVLVLDELSTGLDPSARERIWSQVEQVRDEGTSILIVSHSMEEVERLCDRIVLLAGGQIAATGTPAEFIAAQQRAGHQVQTMAEAYLAATGIAAESDEGEW